MESFISCSVMSCLPPVSPSLMPAVQRLLVDIDVVLLEAAAHVEADGVARFFLLRFQLLLFRCKNRSCEKHTAQ